MFGHIQNSSPAFCPSLLQQQIASMHAAQFVRCPQNPSYLDAPSYSTTFLPDFQSGQSDIEAQPPPQGQRCTIKFEDGPHFISNTTAAGQGMARLKDESRHPKQDRRKAQNKAAQRAFRERKEQHVKNLEQENAILQTANLDMENQNRRLKEELDDVKAKLVAIGTSSDTIETTSPAPATSADESSTEALQLPEPRDLHSRSQLERSRPSRNRHSSRLMADGHVLFVNATWSLSTPQGDSINAVMFIEHLKHLAISRREGLVFEVGDIMESLVQCVATQNSLNV